MSIKNLMEEIVADVVSEIVRNDKDLQIKKTSKDDIVAYVLNRVEPKYVTSERGVIHGMLDRKFIAQQRSDILFLVYEAVGVIKNRRESQSGGETGIQAGISAFPHILGEVLEETTFSIIPNVEVTLLYNGNKAEMIDGSWKNPCLTHRATKGYYHFWPTLPQEKRGKAKTHTFTMRFSHPKFVEKEVPVDIETLSHDEATGSRVLPIVLLSVKEGVDLDFLYD